MYNIILTQIKYIVKRFLYGKYRGRIFLRSVREFPTTAW